MSLLYSSLTYYSKKLLNHFMNGLYSIIYWYNYVINILLQSFQYRKLLSYTFNDGTFPNKFSLNKTFITSFGEWTSYGCKGGSIALNFYSIGVETLTNLTPYNFRHPCWLGVISLIEYTLRDQCILDRHTKEQCNLVKVISVYCSHFRQPVSVTLTTKYGLLDKGKDSLDDL